VSEVARYGNATQRSPDVRIDASGSQEFRLTLTSQLRQSLNRRVSDMRMSGSAGDPLVQLADMCIGAVTRAVRSEREDRDRWLRMLLPRIGNIWHFH
jgi:hypothetical protein